MPKGIRKPYDPLMRVAVNSFVGFVAGIGTDYQCQVCGRRYMRKPSLVHHIKKEHEQNIKDAVNEMIE